MSDTMDRATVQRLGKQRRELLQDPNEVHINMLSGTIAKITPAQIGHLYRGQDAVDVIAEVLRQNPEVLIARDGTVSRRET